MVTGRGDLVKGPGISRRSGLLLLATGLAASGCTSRPLLERAIRARGGVLESFVRSAEADVQAGFPGAWQWRTAFLAPDRYAWSITTAAGVDHYMLDGAVVRAFVGGRQVSSDATRGAPLRAHARFTAVTNLDTVVDSRAAVTPLAAAELPPGVTTGVSVVLPDDGSRYGLGFDERLLLVWARGPFDAPQLGAGEITARFDDHRRVHGLLLPFRISYAIGTRPLAVERTLAVCPNDPALTPASFASPERLPDCAGP